MIVAHFEDHVAAGCFSSLACVLPGVFDILLRFSSSAVFHLVCLSSDLFSFFFCPCYLSLLTSLPLLITCFSYILPAVSLTFYLY